MCVARLAFGVLTDWEILNQVQHDVFIFGFWVLFVLKNIGFTPYSVVLIVPLELNNLTLHNPKGMDIVIG